ncbi:hypothetical protein HU200_003984 [Digitaria exilis]|uniref:Protein LURP-one-related 8 n=1 Tax=Digitaria exilis TaxID=1010633 RepID=A0A835KXU8_9POAL|nr:hypothetical protein HU200_003984 [Digitaria exilis]
MAPEPAIGGTGEEAEVLTVWRKSLLFNCDGFTVFDAKGNLAFRVDCYGSSWRRRAEVVLMDVAGKPLLTVRRRRISLSEQWVIYDGDATEPEPTPRRGAEAKPLLSVRRHASLVRASSNKKKALAHVTTLGSAVSSSSASYVVEGSYGRRACAVRDAGGDAVVAEVRRKEFVGDDVFRLVAHPGRLGAPLAMGLVIALDEMFTGTSSARSLLRRTWSA